MAKRCLAVIVRLIYAASDQLFISLKLLLVLCHSLFLGLGADWLCQCPGVRKPTVAQHWRSQWYPKFKL